MPFRPGGFVSCQEFGTLCVTAGALAICAGLAIIVDSSCCIRRLGWKGGRTSRTSRTQAAGGLQSSTKPWDEPRQSGFAWISNVGPLQLDPGKRYFWKPGPALDGTQRDGTRIRRPMERNQCSIKAGDTGLCTNKTRAPVTVVDGMEMRRNASPFHDLLDVRLYAIHCLTFVLQVDKSLSPR